MRCIEHHLDVLERAVRRNVDRRRDDAGIRRNALVNAGVRRVQRRCRDRAPRLRGSDGRESVDEAKAVAVRVVVASGIDRPFGTGAVNLGRGLCENVLHITPRESLVGFEHQCHDTGNQRSCSRSATLCHTETHPNPVNQLLHFGTHDQSWGSHRVQSQRYNRPSCHRRHRSSRCS